MKKLMLLILAACTLSSVYAQRMNEDKRNEVIENMIQHMIPINGKYAITRTPVSYYQYWAITNKKAHTANTSVSQAAYVTDAQQKNAASCLNKESGGQWHFTVATSSQIMEAKRKGLQGDIQSHGASTQGFYLVLPFKEWQELTGK